MLAFNFTPFPALTTERLILRQLTLADAPAMYALRSDPRVMQYIPRPLAQSVEDAAAFIEQMNALTAATVLLNWGITRRDEEQVMGTIGYYSLRPEHFRAEIGYMLRLDYQGQGFMQEAVAAVLDYGFEVLRLHSVEAVMDPANAASARVAERNHFVKEGHFRESESWDGKFLDTAVYSLLRTAKR